MIAGLYPYTRAGVNHSPGVTLQEIPDSLTVNPTYRDDLLVLAGDEDSATLLEEFGLAVYRVFDDAPAEIHHDAAHKMKHWMCRWALEEYGEFLWVDWDTLMLRRPDMAFLDWCRSSGTPKFIWIPDYWATVNCGVYYASKNWLSAMEGSFDAPVSEPNDELLWATVLPTDIHERQEFWWGERVAQIWTPADFKNIGSKTYFAHVKHLGWANAIRKRFVEIGSAY